MKKKISIEEKIWNYVNNHTYLIYFILITLFSLIVRYVLFKYKSGDYTMFLKPWFDELKLYGGLPGLGMSIGNYTPIYMTILAILTYFPIDSLISIKIVSIIFDYLGAYFVYKIVLELFKDKDYKKRVALICYGIYLLLPTVFLNSAYWGQSDGIYTSFVIISLYYLIKKDFIKGIIFWSIAFAFKFQAIFIFPLYVLIYFSDRKIKFKYFLIIPIIVFVFSIPKIIFSHKLLDGFDVYMNQSNTYSSYITLNFPNVYSIYLNNANSSNNNLIETPLKEMGTIGIIITLVIFMTIALLVIRKKVRFDSKTIIEFGLWSILICTFFLPQMHERYLFMGDVISILYFILNRKKYYIPIIVELVSLNGYMYLLFSGFATNLSMFSILYLVVLMLYSKDMFTKYLKSKELV